MSLLKKRFHPLGGFYYDGVLKWLMLANPLMLCIGLAMWIHDIYSLWDEWMIEKRDKWVYYLFRLSFWTGYALHMSIGFLFDLYLYRAVKRKNILRLKIWSVVNSCNGLFAIIIYWSHTFYFGLHFPSLTPYNFYCIYRLYVSVIIYYYSLEVENQKEAEEAARGLSDSELAEFELGLKSDKMLEMATNTLMEKVMYMRYKREDFEIDMGSLEIDEDNILGRGQYGVVYSAIYHSESGSSQQVAVKTFEPGYMDAYCFKALLTELKVMTYLERHDHMLNLIGAVTVDIKKRSLHMVTEFCPYGCLLEHLRASRALFTNLVVDGCVNYNRVLETLHSEDLGEINTLDLIRWSSEVASGMTHLQNMKVVHGDLAARNLLLNERKQIKIADFGLARQLYQYSVYVKRQNTQLPWRHLALESILDMNFSIKSDVWGFGIVLHEIFSLGELPYDETKQFTLEFIENVRNGMRLEQVAFCPDAVYRLMLLCWNENPEERPLFHDLHNKLLSLLQNNTMNDLSMPALPTITVPNQYVPEFTSLSNTKNCIEYV